MARSSAVQRNLKRKRLTKKHATTRAKLKALIMNKTTSIEERFAVQLKLQKLPLNSNKDRVRNRCELTGRPRGFYRKFQISRIKLRELTSAGKIPGVVKSSW